MAKFSGFRGLGGHVNRGGEKEEEAGQQVRRERVSRGGCRGRWRRKGGYARIYKFATLYSLLLILVQAV